MAENGNAVAVPAHGIRLNGAQQAKAQDLMRRFEKSPFAPPSVKECQEQVGEEVFGALIELGELKQLSAEVVFRVRDYEQMLEKVREFIHEKGKINVADARDLFNSSRKYMLALMEHLDSAGITIREGDFRKLSG